MKAPNVFFAVWQKILIARWARGSVVASCSWRMSPEMPEIPRSPDSRSTTFSRLSGSMPVVLRICKSTPGSRSQRTLRPTSPRQMIWAGELALPPLDSSVVTPHLEKYQNMRIDKLEVRDGGLHRDSLRCVVCCRSMVGKCWNREYEQADS